MALRIIRGTDHAPIEPLRDRTVAVLGYGNQGHAHALNLRDSGIRTIVASRSDSAGGRRARDDGFEPVPIEDAVGAADLVIVALPDEVQPACWAERIGPNLRSGSTVGFLHGFAIRYGGIVPGPDVGVIMVAPKGPGATLRRVYVEGRGIPALLAVDRESPRGDAEALGLAWANGIGCARAAIVFTTFADETETDLFGEQAVLCGGMTELIVAAFETLVAEGYPPELAYLECCHEVKQVADLVYERGLAGMMRAISNTAEFGAYSSGPVLIDDAVRARMRDLLTSIRDGNFAGTLQRDHASGFPWFNEQRDRLSTHDIEQAGTIVRGLMPWLGSEAGDEGPRPSPQAEPGRS
jgi:ketol-acid reductoisomerase